MKDAVGRSVTVRIGGAAATARTCDFAASGQTITFHGFLKAYVESVDDDRRPTPTTREPRLPQPRRGRAVCGREHRRASGHETQPPARYTEAVAGQGAGGAGDRPAVDVRVDHRHDPGPRLRVQEGHGAGADLAGVRGDPAARGALPAAGRLRLHRQRWRTSSTRSPAGRREPQHRADRLLLRQRRPWRACSSWSPSSARSTPAS